MGVAHTYEKQRFSTSESDGSLLVVNKQGNAELDEVLRSRFSVFSLRTNAVDISREHRSLTNVLCAEKVHR